MIVYKRCRDGDKMSQLLGDAPRVQSHDFYEPGYNVKNRFFN